jgi:hypothetical protein
VIGVAKCGRECERWVYERILRDACRLTQQGARPSGLTYRRLPNANDKCLLNSFLNVRPPIARRMHCRSNVSTAFADFRFPRTKIGGADDHCHPRCAIVHPVEHGPLHSTEGGNHSDQAPVSRLKTQYIGICRRGSRAVAAE